jgi:hypothetical protein
MAFNRKEKIFWATIYVVCLGVSSYTVWNYDIQPTEVKCGKLIDKAKPTELTLGRHSGTISVDETFTMKWDDGTFMDINHVNANTYNKYEVGDNVCFEVDKYQSQWIGMWVAIATMTLWILGIIGFAIICTAIGNLYNLIFDKE